MLLMIFFNRTYNEKPNQICLSKSPSLSLFPSTSAIESWPPPYPLKNAGSSAFLVISRSPSVSDAPGRRVGLRVGLRVGRRDGLRVGRRVLGLR